NGRPLVAEDVLYSFNRQMTKDPVYVNASLLAGLAKLEAPDRSTIKLTLDRPSADFLLGVASPQTVVIAKEAVDVKGDLKTGPMIGTGPFIIEKTDPNGTNLGHRNPDYFVS